MRRMSGRVCWCLSWRGRWDIYSLRRVGSQGRNITYKNCIIRSCRVTPQRLDPGRSMWFQIRSSIPAISWAIGFRSPGTPSPLTQLYRLGLTELRHRNVRPKPPKNNRKSKVQAHHPNSRPPRHQQHHHKDPQLQPNKTIIREQGRSGHPLYGQLHRPENNKFADSQKEPQSPGWTLFCE